MENKANAITTNRLYREYVNRSRREMVDRLFRRFLSYGNTKCRCSREEHERNCRVLSIVVEKHMLMECTDIESFNDLTTIHERVGKILRELHNKIESIKRNVDDGNRMNRLIGVLETEYKNNA